MNTQAAQNLQKNVEGKITVALNEGVGNTQKNGETPKFNSIISLAAGKDKNGSAPSYKGEFLFIKKIKKKKKSCLKPCYKSPFATRYKVYCFSLFSFLKVSTISFSKSLSSLSEN